uniref:EamA domain-containing protein n=1 Tax=Heterosigma akashiwo TaxID=2829 RepID=A0A7S3XNJ7_HETAK
MAHSSRSFKKKLPADSGAASSRGDAHYTVERAPFATFPASSGNNTLHSHERAPSATVVTSYQSLQIKQPKKIDERSNDYCKAIGLLFVVASLCASNGPSTKILFEALERPPPILAWSALVAVIGFLASVAHRLSFSSNRCPRLQYKEIKVGFELGVIRTLGNILFCIGIVHTSATHAAFCTSTTTIIVPFIQRFSGIPVSGLLWVSCLVCTLGTYLLITDPESVIEGAQPSDSSQFLELLGDGLCLCAAVCYAVLDIRTAMASQTINFHNLIFTSLGGFAVSSVLAALSPLLGNGYTTDILRAVEDLKNHLWLSVLSVGWQGLMVQCLSMILLVPSMVIVNDETTFFISFFFSCIFTSFQYSSS